MTVTPAVSADRRYVRLNVNAYFNAINGFTNFTTPLGAVSGGGAAGGGAGGGNFNAGMNGVIGVPDNDSGTAYSLTGVVGPFGEFRATTFGELRAGTLPLDAQLGAVRSEQTVGGWNSGSASAGVGWWESDFSPGRPRPVASISRSDASFRAGGNAPAKALASRRGVPRKETPALSQKARRARVARAADTSDVEPIVKPKKPR
jgi:hypothetical protein